MRTVRTVILAGAAIAGLTGLALAAGPAMHEMTVAIPGGGVAHVRYTGDVAPKIAFVQAPANPAAVRFWAPSSPFAELDRITALMDRQMMQMMYQARMIQMKAMQDPLYSATLREVSAGSPGYNFVSTLSGGNFCARSTVITASANGGAPTVVTKTSGNCGTPSATAQPTAEPSAPELQTISYKPAQSNSQSRQHI